jgi:hypothetical protein
MNLMNDAKVVFRNTEIYGIKISVAKYCFSGYTQKMRRCYGTSEVTAKHVVHRANLLGLKIGLLLSLAIFQCALAAASEPPESILSHIERANLATVSALGNSSGEVQKLPAQMFSLISLIDSRGVIVSTEKEACKLINKYERFSLVSKGKIAGENPFGAKGFEAAITGDGTAGKLIIYSDSLLSSPFLYIRWRQVDAETEYLRRTFQADTVTEELLVIRRDGSGHYRAGLRGKTKEVLRWTVDGKAVGNDEKR